MTHSRSQRRRARIGLRGWREGLWVVCLAPRLSYGALHGNDISSFLQEPSRDLDTDEFAWQERLGKCGNLICSENSVDETMSMANACASISIRSDHGGAGRSTVFGRSLWCAAQFSKGPVLDLYAGKGDSVSLFADAVQKRHSGSRTIVTFEISRAAAAITSSRLRRYGFSVLEVLFESGISETSVKEAMSWTPPSNRVGIILFVASTATLVQPGLRRLLAVVSSYLDASTFVNLDPDTEMDPHAFAADWRSLEKLPPRIVSMYNTNLPGGTGWIKDRLLHIGTYAAIANGSNDGGADEPDEFLQMRAWSILLFNAPLAADSGALPHTAEEMVQSLVTSGGSWMNTTFRAALQGKIKRIHEPLAGHLVAVEMQRPTSDLLQPPNADTNPLLCFAEADPRVSARKIRVPCFLTCEGPTFDPAWSDFRRKLAKNVELGFPIDDELFMQATHLAAPVVQNDTALIIGRSRWMSRLRHEFTSDEHLSMGGHQSGFCLYGISSAMFIRARHYLNMEPREFMWKDKKVFAPSIALHDLETAFSLLADSNTKASIEFSFLENSAWSIDLEDIIFNFERQRATLGAPFDILSLETRTRSVTSLGLVGDLQKRVTLPEIRSQHSNLHICGVGDHLTATFDTMLMVEQSLQSVGIGTSGKFVRHMLGRFCPSHAGQQHQCRQKCQLLGVGCGHANEEADPIEKWLDRVIHPETFEELGFDLIAMAADLVEQIGDDVRFANSDLIVCSHPTILCIILSTVSTRPVFTHASSTLLYGLFCDRCSTGSLNVHSTLRLYRGENVMRYFTGIRRMYWEDEGADTNYALFAEGKFLATQISYQVDMPVQWVPPLALYVQQRWAGMNKRSAVILRSRFFTTLMGELMRSLIREIFAINNVKDITFLGADNQFDEQWLTLEEIAGFGAAVLYPNDVHQRTFHEVYRMGLPLFVPDARGLYRSQRAANWGYSSYGGELFSEKHGHSGAPWWNSFNATPDIVIPFQALADWEQFPHVQRFASIPSLMDLLSSVDLEEVSRNMLAFHATVMEESLQAVATKVVAMLR